MDKSWMCADRRSREYELGVDEFLRFAVDNARNVNLTHCPCVKCGNILKFGARTIRDHLYCNGVDTSYHTWIWHGEPNTLDADANELFVGTNEQGYVSETVDMEDNGFGDFSNDPREFLNVIEDGDEPLYPGCKFSKLGALVRLYNLKAKHGLSDVGFTKHLIFLTELLPEGNQLPCSLYEAKKTLHALGMDYEKIHSCPNHCILYRKEFDQLTNCPKCSLSRWRMDKSEHVREGVSAKVLWYFPPIPRFKCMFKSSRTAESLTWHANNKMSDGHKRHSSDSPSWKLVDDKWPEFGKDPRSLRLALSADGINPHGSLSSRYSCWHVIMIIYNLPPWLCMKRKFMMLTLLISGPKQVDNDIDVYLEPLIDDLKCLWTGVPGVYDAFRGEYFMLKAQLMWIINDFPAYGNLSGCVVKGYKACPICGEDTPSHRLTHGNKVCYIGHRSFLPQDHSFRKQPVTFNGEQEFRPPPVVLTGEEVFRKVDGLAHAVDDKDNRPCWKRKSIFFELEYWKFLHIRHCLDVMHIEKNVCESIIGTLLEIPGKNKDGVATRLDLLEMGVKTYLRPDFGGKRTRLSPNTWNLTRAEKRVVCNSLYGMKVPEGYASNVKSLVSLQDLKLYGLKSHDCHTLMQQLLPVALRSVMEKPVRYALIRLCFFFNEICDKVIDISKLEKMQADVVVTLCLLEKYFPPSFFDIMIHVVVHLVREVRLCGPVYFRWMYPFEIFMKVLKGYVRNRNRPEGCIVECYIGEEALEFCEEYLSDVSTIGIPSRRNKCRTQPLSGATVESMERDMLYQAHRYVLDNTDEVEPYISEHMIHLKETYPRFKKRTKWLQDKHNRTFIDWFRKRVAHELTQASNDITETLRWLSDGPCMEVLKYKSYSVNGLHFTMKSRDDVRAVQNSGVHLVAKTMQLASAKDKNPVVGDMSFYGVIQEIWELDYHKFRVPLFKCDWVENNNGIKVDELGFTLVNLGRIGFKKDQFVMANLVKQVFYVEDPLDSMWSVVLSTPNRDYNDCASDDELGDIVIDHEPFTRGMPAVEAFDDVFHEDNSQFMRDDCEDIWIDKE